MKYRISHSSAMLATIWIGLTISASLQYVLFRAGFSVSDFGFSIEFVFLLAVSIFSTYIAKVSFTSLFFLTVSSFSLFIGGRFIANILGYDSGEGVFDLHWMASYVASEEIRNSTFLYVATFFCIFNLGYFIFRPKNSTRKYSPKINPLVSFMLLLVFGCIECTRLIGVFASAFSAGYASIYSSQAGEYSAGAATLSILFYVAVSLAFVSGKTFLKLTALGLLFLTSALSLAAGVRGGFVASVLLFLWLYGRNHKISLKKLAISFLLIGACLAAALKFSARYSDDTGISMMQLPLSFIYSQGVSLGVFSYTQTFDAFPTTAYIQSLLPGALFFIEIFSGKVVLHDANFQNFISWSANPSRYASGNGLGWTLLSDFYVYSFGLFPLYIALAFFSGCAMRFLDSSSRSPGVWMALCVGLSLKLFMLPRSSISTVISFAFYFLILYSIARIFSKGRSRRYRPKEIEVH